VACIFPLEEKTNLNMPSSKKKIQHKEAKPKGIPIPAGTEQETGFTRAETEKVNGPVKFPPILKNKKQKK
jgi:hypothetical protein